MLTGRGESNEDEHVEDAGDGCWIRGTVELVETETLNVFVNEEQGIVVDIEILALVLLLLLKLDVEVDVELDDDVNGPC